MGKRYIPRVRLNIHPRKRQCPPHKAPSASHMVTTTVPQSPQGTSHAASHPRTTTMTPSLRGIWQRVARFIQTTVPTFVDFSGVTSEHTESTEHSGRYGRRIQPRDIHYGCSSNFSSRFSHYGSTTYISNTTSHYGNFINTCI